MDVTKWSETLIKMEFDHLYLPQGSCLDNVFIARGWTERFNQIFDYHYYYYLKQGTRELRF